MNNRGEFGCISTNARTSAHSITDSGFFSIIHNTDLTKLGLHQVGLYAKGGLVAWVPQRPFFHYLWRIKYVLRLREKCVIRVKREFDHQFVNKERGLPAITAQVKAEVLLSCIDDAKAPT